MKQDDQQTLKDFFSLVIKNNLNDQRITKASFQSRVNVDFYYLDWGADRLIIKRYPNKDYFDRELSALEALAGTNRVCPVLFHSRLLDEYWQQDFKGPYLVVKPYYKGFLQGDLEKSPLLLLERAAQVVSISEKLFRYGWRDLDGNIGNDAVEDGRLVRFDLDGAQPRWATADRYNTPNLALGDTLACKEIGTAQQTLFQEEAELESVALRLSRLLLNQVDVNQWSLKDEVLSLKKDKPVHGLTGLLTHFGFKERARSSYDKAAKRRLWLEGEWVTTWERRLSSPDGNIMQFLRKAEARLLGLLFFHILSHSEHGFCLQDLYMSLMLLDCGALSERYPLMVKPGPPTRNSDLFRDLIRNLKGELGNFKKDPPQEEAATTKPTKSKLPPPPDVFELQLSSDGHAWGGPGKGTGRECEDLVILPVSDNRPILLLADGASLANGFEAIQVAKAVFEQWEKDFKFGSQLENKIAIGNLIKNIHQELLRITRRDAKPRETTVVIIMVVNNPEDPYALMIRYGNSGYLMTHESKAGQFSYRAKSSSTRYPKPLGAFELDLKRLQISEVSLTLEGIYRIRAWSDGVADKEEDAEKMVDKATSIQELIKEANQWAEEHHTVGDDDWAVAGFDINVMKKKPALQEEEESAALSEDNKATALDPLDALLQFDPQKFIFSDSALAFWRTRLQEDETLKELIEYPVIKDALNLLSPVSPTQKPLAMTGHVSVSMVSHTGAPLVGQTQKTERKSLLRPISLAIAVLIILMSVWYFSQSPDTAQNHDLSDTSPSAAATPFSSARYNFETPEALAIYQKLASGDPWIIENLPANSAIDAEPLKTSLNNLAEVLAKTKMRVNITVHTDMTGSPEINMLTSNERADYIRNKLIQKGGITDTQIRVLGMGESLPAIQHELSPEDRSKNRRLIVTEISGRTQ